MAILFYILPHRWRWLLLLAGSYLFYMSWNPKYIIVLLARDSHRILGWALACQGTHPKSRRLMLTFSLLTILGILFFFKYFQSGEPPAPDLFNQLGASDLLSGIRCATTARYLLFYLSNDQLHC